MPWLLWEYSSLHSEWWITYVGIAKYDGSVRGVSEYLDILLILGY